MRSYHCFFNLKVKRLYHKKALKTPYNLNVNRKPKTSIDNSNIKEKTKFQLNTRKQKKFS